jgi:hypothetical protein
MLLQLSSGLVSWRWKAWSSCPSPPTLMRRPTCLRKPNNFRALARIAVLVSGASGFYMIYALDAWSERRVSEESAATMSLIQRLPWILLAASLITVFGAVADSHGQRLGPEIRFQDIVDDAVQILDCAAMLRDVAKRFVTRHFGIARAPECFRLRV